MSGALDQAFGDAWMRVGEFKYLLRGGVGLDYNYLDSTRGVTLHGPPDALAQDTARFVRAWCGAGATAFKTVNQAAQLSQARSAQRRAGQAVNSLVTLRLGGCKVMMVVEASEGVILVKAQK